MPTDETHPNILITPGPWEWYGNNLVALGGRTTLLRNVSFWNPNPGDKGVIAAAPVMLEALRATEIVLRNRDQSEREAALLAAIKAIIAKIENVY